MYGENGMTKASICSYNSLLVWNFRNSIEMEFLSYVLEQCMRSAFGKTTRKCSIKCGRWMNSALHISFQINNSERNEVFHVIISMQSSRRTLGSSFAFHNSFPVFDARCSMLDARCSVYVVQCSFEIIRKKKLMEPFNVFRAIFHIILPVVI